MTYGPQPDLARRLEDTAAARGHAAPEPAGRLVVVLAEGLRRIDDRDLEAWRPLFEAAFGGRIRAVDHSCPAVALERRGTLPVRYAQTKGRPRARTHDTPTDRRTRHPA